MTCLRLLRNMHSQLGVLVMIVLFSGAALRAQTLAEITGEVTDASGAVVVAAKVTVTNENTNVSREVTTNTSGVYSFPALQPGIYVARVEMLGFQSAVRSGIQLQVQQVARIDFELRVGQVTEVIEVTGAAPLLTTESATTGTVIENKRIVELPLNGRNFLQLVALSPNVSFGFPTSGQQTGRQGGQRTEQTISISGQRAEFNNFTLDGVSNTDVNFNTYVFLPSIDALEEFKVQTGVYPAEFGTAVSQVNVSTKAGSNDFHGTMFEFFRNDDLDANNYSFTPLRTEKDPFVRNQYGFTLGGPVLIPRLLNGRNKLFFMVNYEALRDRKGLRRTADVAPEAMRRGDFSGIANRLFDPATRARQANGTITAEPFANNMIPSTRFNSKSVKLLEFYPLPNVHGPGLSRNYQATEGRRLDTDQFTVRIDFSESSSSNWFGRYSWGDDLQLTPRTFPEQGLKLQVMPQQTMLSNTRVFGPTVVNEFRFGYSRFINDNLNFNSGQRDVITEIGGFPGVATPYPLIWGTPSIGINGLSGFGESSDGPFVNRDHIFQWVDNVSVIRGTHSFRFGAEIRRDRFNQLGNQHPRGSPSFLGTATQNPAAPAGSGYGFADYMLGLIREVDGALDLANSQLRATRQAYYIDDTWKVRPNLTLNLGLRYEFTPHYYHKHDNMINTEIRADGLTLVRPGSGDFYEDFLFVFNPAIDTARDGRLGRKLVNDDLKDFAPRIGIAYSPTPKWTLRTGFGIFYTHDIGNLRFDMSRNSAARRRDVADSDFPDLTFDVPFRGIGEAVLVNNPLVLSNDVHGRTPYVLQFLFNVQRQLSPDTLLELGYTGNVSHRLERWTPANFPLPGPGNVEERRPFPGLGIIQLAGGGGNANYNAATLKLQRRFTAGLTYLVSYTYSRSIDWGSAVRIHGGEPNFPLDPYHVRETERGVSNFHQAHRYVTSVLWEPSLGAGKRVDLGPVGNAILGNWQLGTIFTIRSALPYTVGVGGDPANRGWGEQRPNRTQASLEPAGGKDPAHYINPDAFSFPAQFTLGNVGRNTMLGPRFVGWDFLTMKRFPITEGHELQFRFEAFNFPNHPNFGFPNSNLSSSSFGTISSTVTEMRELQFSLKYVF